MKPIAAVEQEHVLRRGDQPTGECQRVGQSVQCPDGSPGSAIGLDPADVVVIRNLRHHDVTGGRLAGLEWGLFASHALRLASILGATAGERRETVQANAWTVNSRIRGATSGAGVSVGEGGYVRPLSGTPRRISSRDVCRD